MGLDLGEEIFMNSVTWLDINIKHERLYELIGIVIAITLCWEILNTHEYWDPYKINDNVTLLNINGD